MTFKVGIDAGHGINTAGKRTPDDEREWTFNNVVIKAFISELKKYKDVSIKRFDDPTGKKDVPLDDRTDGANKWGADIYISFHHNANTGDWGDWTGVETYVYTSKPAGSMKLAKAVHPALVKGYGLKDRGIKPKNLHIVRETEMSAILVEGGFMDSTIDIKKLRSNSVLRKAGREMAKAVAKYAGLKLKTKAKSVKPSKISGKTYKVKSGDTLWRISQASSVSVGNLKKYNNLKTNLITVGQVLSLVPKSTSKSKSNGITEIGTIQITNLNNFTYIYSKTNDSSTRLGKAVKNTKFPIAGSVTGWWEVIYEGRRAYVKAKYGRLL